MAGRQYGLKCLFAGGGTGGHVFPGIAIAEKLLQIHPQTEVLFVGTDRPLESDLLGKAGFAHRALPSLSLSASTRHPLRFVQRNWEAYRIALGILQQERPQVVVGCGGFASAATIVAARRLSIPVLLLEQNVIPGKTTRLFARMASIVCVSFAETTRHLTSSVRVQHTGNPVRDRIAALAAERQSTANTPHTPTLLVLGGSQGAAAINAALLQCLREFPEGFQHWRVVHQTGARDASRVHDEYLRWQLDAQVAPFLDDMPAQLSQADLVVSRAGGTTLAEIACAALPSILLPYPHATDDHQWHNAQAFRAAGAALVIRDDQDQSSMTAELSRSIHTLMADARERDRMGEAARALAKPNAATDLAGLVHSYFRKEAA